MKWSKKTKSILAISSAAALTLPALTLTGCSNISQYCIPVVTDGNPFYVGSSGILDPYRSGYGYYNTPEPESATTKEAYQITTPYLQLPSGYLYTSEYTSEFNQKVNGMYGYCNFNKPEWKHEGPISDLNDKYEFNRKNDYDWAWRGVTSDDLQHLSNGALSSYQNLNIGTAIASINTATNWFIKDFNYMNSYLNTIIGQKKEEDINKSLLYLFTGKTSDTNNFTFGSDSNDKSNFYQFYLDNANLLSTSASKYKFGPYNVGWTFKDISGFGSTDPIMTNFGESTNPYLNLTMKDLSKYEYGFKDKSGVNTPSNKDQPYVFPVNENFTGTYLWSNKDTKNPEYTYTAPKTESTFLNPYIKYTYKDNKISDFGSIASIPMLISPKHIQSAYYDPSKNISTAIQPADCLTKNTQANLDDINKKLKDEGSWNDVKKNVNLNDLNVTTLTFDQKSSYSLNDLDYTDPSTVDNPYSSWMTSEVSEAYKSGKMDSRVKNWIKHGEINFGDWVVLANYSTFIVNFQYKYTDSDGEQTQCIKALLPYFEGFSIAFPAYMLFTNADCYKEVNSTVEDGQEKTYYIEYANTGLEKDVNASISALTDYKTPEFKTYSSTADMFKNNVYMPFIWNFGKLGEQGVVSGQIESVNASKYYDFYNNPGIVNYSNIVKNADPSI